MSYRRAATMVSLSEKESLVKVTISQHQSDNSPDFSQRTPMSTIAIKY
jgi:vacuolar-type H+-ATPase catalytic subunit A/Vma1